ncbi:hypothetical protein [Fischerella sp. JS2]|nr:hypothetical protein [Fischerella sp. JS2]
MLYPASRFVWTEVLLATLLEIRLVVGEELGNDRKFDLDVVAFAFSPVLN